VLGQPHAVNPDQTGTKVAAHYRRTIGAGESATLRLRLTAVGPAGRSPVTTGVATPFGPEWAETLAARRTEADEFYRSVTPPSVSPDAANVMRQAIAGMLWSKQFYFFDGWVSISRRAPARAAHRPASRAVIRYGDIGSPWWVASMTYRSAPAPSSASASAASLSPVYTRVTAGAVSRTPTFGTWCGSSRASNRSGPTAYARAGGAVRKPASDPPTAPER
jgi:hypothetical protein